MRALLGAGLALAAMAHGAAAQSEAALRRAFEGKTVTVRIDMPGTSQGIDVNPLETDPVNFREVAQRLKENGTAVRIGQQMMITKVAVRDWYVEFHLGGGGYGTTNDLLNEQSSVQVEQQGETREERRLRDLIRSTTDREQRKRLERDLDDLRSRRERANARARAEAERTNIAREASLRVKRAESGSRFNVRYRGGFPPDALTPDGMMRALAPYVDFANAPVDRVGSGGGGPGVSGLRKGQSIAQVEALLGPAVTAADSQDGSRRVTKRTYHHDEMHIVASFVSGVLVDFVITPL
jgi:hypothetical protein